MKNIAIFASGSGSDMQSVIDGVKDGRIDGKVKLIITNKNGIYAIERAKLENIPCKTFTLKEYGSHEVRDMAILKELKDNGIDLVVLAGYLSIVTPVIVNEYERRIINIHPSLIPSFCGKGFYGLKVHEEALARGVKVTGATVHFVDEGTDTGPIILQKPVAVQEGDTPESLQRRVMEEAEWVLLPKAIELIASGLVSVVEGRVLHGNLFKSG